MEIILVIITSLEKSASDTISLSSAHVLSSEEFVDDFWYPCYEGRVMCGIVCEVKGTFEII